ncbi:hypothetical protein BGZ98_006991 [Dissophora globulifera]|nr:hypothetical protein BGZ98_006991 [Dissophora globulifera]
MDFLAELFPTHPRETLQHHLDSAQGSLDIAVETLLATPMPGAVCRNPHHHHHHVHPIHIEDDEYRSAKRPRIDDPDVVVTNSIPGPVVYDLTQDSDSEDNGGGDHDKDHDKNNINISINRPLSTDAATRIVVSIEHITPSLPSISLPVPASQTPLAPTTFTEALPATAAPATTATEATATTMMTTATTATTATANPLASLTRTSSLPSFDDFHLEQQRLQDEQAQKAAQMEAQRQILVSNFITIAQDMFKDISLPFLEEKMAETRRRIGSDNELIDACIESIFALNGNYPKTKSKRRRDSDSIPDVGASGSRHRAENCSFNDDDDDDDDDSGDGGDGNESAERSESSSSLPKRDFNDCTIKMSAAYEHDCASQLYQDFPLIASTSIRACLNAYSYHYIPVYEYLVNHWAVDPAESRGKAKAGDIKIVLIQVPRKKSDKARILDSEFKRELEFHRAKLAKEAEELKEIEEEEKNTAYYKGRNELIECGCCYDDVPPNRVAQCEEGHLFCFECSRRGAEVELGYRRTVLKCMSGGCTAVFTNSEATKFLSRSVFQGLQRARQQEELKMAGLDSLVECPFCSYAAVVENDEDREFRCQAPKCSKVSCRLCKAPTHIPLSCEEYQREQEKNNVLSAQHKVEEHMSQALIRECPKCKARFFKTEGCNKMTCPQCQTKMCYICKIQIKDYSHFDQTPATQAAKNKKLCRLWDNTIERNENDVKEAAQRMLQALEADKPDVAAQVRLDIPATGAPKKK